MTFAGLFRPLRKRAFFVRADFTPTSCKSLADATASMLFMCIAVQTRPVPVHILASVNAVKLLPSFQVSSAMIGRRQTLTNYRNKLPGETHE
jgi:hypothetical protein